MGQVIQLHQTKQAKASGVFAAVNIAARNMGYSGQMALRVAQDAKKRYLEGGTSPARVVSDNRALLRTRAEPVLA